jgi:hypothetical protein
VLLSNAGLTHHPRVIQAIHLSDGGQTASRAGIPMHSRRDDGHSHMRF